MMEITQLLTKAKSTQYKHKDWFCNGDKSVYDAMKYYVDSGDFSLTLKSSCMAHGTIEGLPTTVNTIQDAVSYCNEHIDTHWKYLRIKFNGREGGQDVGKLKVQTYVAYENLKDVQDFVEKELV